MSTIEEQPDRNEVVEEHRETIRLVADGDDEAAEMARNILENMRGDDD